MVRLQEGAWKPRGEQEVLRHHLNWPITMGQDHVGTRRVLLPFSSRHSVRLGEPTSETRPDGLADSDDLN